MRSTRWHVAAKGILQILLFVATFRASLAVPLVPPIAQSVSGTFAKKVSDCPALPKREGGPRDVYDLRPDDFKAVMALGDSIVAGLAAKNPASDDPPTQFATEYRGISFALGGDNGAPTLANFLRQYSPGLEGSSTGERLIKVCYGILCPWIPGGREDGYNIARSGAMVSNLDREADALIGVVNKSTTLKVKEDWKFLNIMIGPNDLCYSCVKSLTGDEYEDTMRKLIEKLRKAFPRTVIYAQTLFRVSDLYQLTKSDPHCQQIRKFGLGVTCPCALIGNNDARAKMDEDGRTWNERLIKLGQEYEGKYADFALIVDQGTGNTPPLSFPIDQISKVDCFHPGQAMHEFIAKSLWANLFRPAESKLTSYNISDTSLVYCPNPTDRIQVPL
ncbi:hypothetical protein DFS34DRAFT_312326 [Phlyctochytrium arcticum]|nr:hypothetical protein DFS34DRAFT_312326 [Phlyctochytrium arcticum]